MHELLLRSISGFMFSAIILSSLFLLPPWVFTLIIVSILLYILCFEWPTLTASHKLLWLLTPFYPIVPFLIMIAFNHVDRFLIQLLFIITFSNDTGAYLVGKLFGKHPIAPHISPKKTWEGFIGGSISVLIALYVTQYIRALSYTNIHLILFSLLCATVATAGDFFESWLKRKAHIKDTGAILPGHGGFMDRFDSALFVVLALIVFFKLR